MEINNSLITLHRYFIWANKMRTDFDNLMKRKGNIIEQVMYMSLWYGLLYVVVEGWQGLKLQDKEIDLLLTSKNVHLLKKYRNTIFHFNKKYWDKRLVNFYKEKSTVKWVRQLNLNFGKYFLIIFKHD